MTQTVTVEAMAGDHDAASEAVVFDLDAAMRLYRPKVFRFALASLGETDAAETIAQDCFLKAHKAWKTFRRECSLETWLMQIAINLIRDYTRNRRLQFWRRTRLAAKTVEFVSECFPCAGLSPEAQAVLRQQVDAVWDAARELPERQRTVFLLRFVEDMDVLDIAAATGLKEGTVKAHLFRAVENVRKKLESKR